MSMLCFEQQRVAVVRTFTAYYGADLRSLALSVQRLFALSAALRYCDVSSGGAGTVAMWSC